MAVRQILAALVAAVLCGFTLADDDGFSMWGWPPFGGYEGFGDSREMGGGGNRNYYNIQNPAGYHYNYNNPYQYHNMNNKQSGPKQMSYNRYGNKNSNTMNHGYYNNNPFNFLGMGMGGGSSGEDTGGGGFNWNSLYSGGGYGVQTGGDFSHEAGTGLVHHGGTNWRIPLAGGDSSHETGEDNSVLPPFGGGDSGDSSSQEKIFGGGGISRSSGGKSSGGSSGGGDSSSGGLKPRPPLPTLPTVEPGSGKGCDQPLDLVVMVDVSFQGNAAVFHQLQLALLQLVGDLQLGEHSVRMGLITFSDRVYDVFDLDTDVHLLLSHIKTLASHRYGSDLGGAITRMTRMFASLGRQGVPQAGILITDGRSQNPLQTKMAVKLARAAHVRLVSIGIGAMASDAELLDVAEDFADVFNLDGMGHLALLLLQINRHICPPCLTTAASPVPQTTPRTTPSTTPVRTTVTSTKATASSTKRPVVTTPTRPPYTTPTTPASTAPVTTVSSTVGPGPTTPDICDGCTMVNGVGYKAHWYDCSKFIQCTFRPDGSTTVYIKTCAHGTYWDQSQLACNHAHLVNCAGPCAGGTLQRYPSDSNCRGYWVCQGDKSHGYCCPPQYSYDIIRGCVPNPQCLDDCGTDVGPDTCDKRPVTGRPLQFEQYVARQGWVLMTCAAGSSYNTITCSCSINGGGIPPTVDCRPELLIPFNNVQVKDESGNNNYLQVEGVKVIGDTGYFDGNSLIRVPRFSNLQYGDTVIISLRYRQDGGAGSITGGNGSGGQGTPSAPQALVANGDCNQPSSLYMVTGPQGAVHMGVLSSKGWNSNVSIPGQPGSGWKQAVLVVDKNVLLGSVNGISYETLFSGSIMSSQCALQVGRGTEFKHFTGYMDDITVYLCRPRGF